MENLHTSPFASSTTLLPPDSKGKTRVLPPTYGWWDALPIVSGPNDQRAILWTSKGIISPHAYLPTLTLQPLPPSSRLPAQNIPVPDAVLESVGNFGPPRMFSISPNEQYLFAYFPSVSGLTPGIACIWEGLRLKLNWNVGPGDGIVGCWWLGHEREWTTTVSGEAIRLPSLGPDIGRRTPMVLVLSENFNLQVIYLPIPKIGGEFQDLHINLLHKSSTSPVPGRSLASHTGFICTRAAMGLAYDDSSILFAMHSELLPPATLPVTSNSMDMTLSSAMHPSYSPHAWSEDWEVAGPENMIRLCEVHVKFTGEGWQCTSEPLPPLSPQLSGPISHLLFIPRVPPAQNEQTNEHPNQRKGARFLVIGTTAFGTFKGPIESTLLVHSLRRDEHGNAHTRWAVALDASCRFQARNLLAISPASTVGREQARLLATFSSNIGPGEGNETQVLQLPSLVGDSRYHPLQLKGPGVPSFMAVSPSGTHFAVSGTQNKKKISIHPYPSVRDDTPRSVQTALSRAMLQSQVPYDLYEILGTMDFPAQLESLVSAAKIVRTQVGGGGPQRWDTEITKIMFHVLKHACIKETDDTRRKRLCLRADFTLNICSLHAIESALLDTKPKSDGGVYDEGSVWPIVGMCNWFIEFIESLLRACADYQRKRKANGVDPPEIGIKLHVLLHPSSLSSIAEIIEQMLRFRKTLESESPDDKPSKGVVREVLTDALDQSPVDFDAGLAILNDIKEGLLQLPADELQRSWITHDISDGLRSALDTFTTRLTTPEVVDLLPLYVKPTDIYVPDDATAHLRSQELDIVTKAVLEGATDPLLVPHTFLTCSRCGGRSQIGSFVGGEPSRWRDWERSWGECICGGVWQVA